jgi:CheY-like chemotaxis protein
MSEPDPFLLRGRINDISRFLTVISGVCETLADDPAQGDSQRELARAGLMAADRAAGLIEQMRPAPAERTATARPARVLLVEDDPGLLSLLTAAFKREGYQTYTAANGRQGVALLRSVRPDLMVTDIVMPEMEGIGTILEARRCSPETRVIAISGGGQYGSRSNFLQWASELGADEVLSKPFRMSSLVLAARLVLERSEDAGRAPADQDIDTPTPFAAQR